MQRYPDDPDMEMPLTDLDYDGVIYEPGEAAKKSAQTKGGTRPPNGSPKRKKPVKKKKAPKSHFKLLMLITILSGILICVVMFKLVYDSFSGKSPQIDSQQEDVVVDANKLIAQKENEKIGATMTGVIKEIDYGKKTVNILSFNDKKTHSLKADSSAELRNSYGSSLAFSEFKAGDIVDFIYDGDNDLSSLIISSDGWKHDSKSVKINTDNRTITVESNTYAYNELTSITKGSQPYDAAKIDELDVVTVKGYDDTAYSIDVIKGHGIIQINNKEAIKDGTIEVDNDIYKALSEVGSLTVKEGTHKIIVKGSNSELYTKDIIVQSDETVSLDLSEVQIKTGVLLIKTNVSDYLLSINDMPELSREPLILEYGAYTIKVQKQGYISYETQLIVNQPETTLNIELKKEIAMGTLTVNTTPDGAEMYVDNAKVGYTPVTVEVTQGKHNLTVRLDGYQEMTFSGIDVTSNENIFNIPLQKKTMTESNTESSAAPPQSVTPETEPIITETGNLLQ